MDLEQMKQKYASVLETIQKNNVRLDHLHVQDEKLVMRSAAPKDACKNRVWDAIKVVDPAYSDLLCDISIDSSLPAPVEEPDAQKYIVRPGDSLSKLRRFCVLRHLFCISAPVKFG